MKQFKFTSAKKHNPEVLDLDTNGKNDLAETSKRAEKHGAASVGGVVNDSTGKKHHHAVGPGVHTVEKRVPCIVDIERFQDLCLERGAKVVHQVPSKGKEATEEKCGVPDLRTDRFLDGGGAFHFYLS